MNLFNLLQKLDSNQHEYYSTLSKEELKEVDGVLGYPLLRWMSSCEDDEAHEISIQLVNEIANKHYFTLYNEKNLQFNLLAASGLGQRTKRKWIAPPKRYTGKKVEQILYSIFPSYKDEDIKLWMELNGKEGFKELCVHYGIQEKEMKDALKELK